MTRSALPSSIKTKKRYLALILALPNRSASSFPTAEGVHAKNNNHLTQNMCMGLSGSTHIFLRADVW